MLEWRLRFAKSTICSSCRAEEWSFPNVSLRKSALSDTAGMNSCMNSMIKNVGVTMESNINACNSHNNKCYQMTLIMQLKWQIMMKIQAIHQTNHLHYPLKKHFSSLSRFESRLWLKFYAALVLSSSRCSLEHYLPHPVEFHCLTLTALNWAWVTFTFEAT